ncbi:hypothetical protein [Paenibacillus sp. PL2-23]|uniref:poly(ethylene terephthalate) hydrolase family protein n=1 Tax=Paenibacillus sp. PL2-23 TaxID=2100729 RepID=UPI0030F910A2
MEEQVEAIAGQPASDAEMHPVRPSRWRAMGQWVRCRYRQRLARDSRSSTFACGGLALFSAAAMGTAGLGMPTGLGLWLDMLLFQLVNAILWMIVGFVLSCLLAFAYVPLPRRLAAAFLYTTAQGAVILYFTEIGTSFAIILSFLYTGIGLLLSLLLGAIRTSAYRVVTKASLYGGLAIAVAVTSFAAGWPSPQRLPLREAAHTVQAEVAVQAQPSSPLSDPSLPGPYGFRSFTYGSGEDKHRAGFGAHTDVITETVDASAYITSWSRLKTMFWGFDQRELPLNGTVWMPEGDGPFPLVLIMHGNHLMEYFSDGGYAYLGELLASRGMIAVSVDANFMNYSVWSSLPNDDMKMRGWLLLKHLQQLQAFSGMDGGDNPFGGRIDWEKVGLIGHSRGGQAIAVAADRDSWFADDASLEGLDELKLQALIAIAPTDKVIDKKSAKLKDVHYLTIQGAMDGDVNQFSGERQYHRVTFGAGSEAFKAAIYLSQANHSQFNTAWGHRDERLPGGLLLNLEGLMPAQEQRQAAKVFISAFLEASLHGQAGYKALFQDYRIGSGWLPQGSTFYTVRYDDAGMASIADFEASRSPVTETSGMKAAERVQAKDRDDHNKGTWGMALEWERPGAELKIVLPKGRSALPLEGVDGLAFSLSNLEWELSEGSYDALLPPLPELELIAETHSGAEHSLRLSSFMPAPEPAYTSFLRIGKLEAKAKNNKYKNPTEAVAQSYLIPLALFEHTNAKAEAEPLLASDIAAITFRVHSERGKVMLDDIGWMPKGGAYVNYRE